MRGLEAGEGVRVEAFTKLHDLGLILGTPMVEGEA